MSGGPDKERLASELREAFAQRAMIYHRIDEELSAELGADKSAAILGRAIESHGRAAGAKLFNGIDAGDPRAVADAFLAVSPDGGRLYPAERRDEGGAVTIQVKDCPLQNAWRAAGLAPERIARLCRIAGRFDTGLFGATGVAFSAATWTPGRAGCCTLTLARRP